MQKLSFQCLAYTIFVLQFVSKNIIINVHSIHNAHELYRLHARKRYKHTHQRNMDVLYANTPRASICTNPFKHARTDAHYYTRTQTHTYTLIHTQTYKFVCAGVCV